MKRLVTILGIMLTTSAAIAASNPSINVPQSGSRSLDDSEKQIFLSQLEKVDRGYMHVCYRNLDNYGNSSAIVEAQRKHKTFTDSKSKDTYVYGYLSSILPISHDGLPVDTIIKKVSENEYAVEYQKDFKPAFRNKSFTEVSYNRIEDGLVQHIFKLADNLLVYQYSKYDILTRSDSVITSKPHVRCAAIEKTSVKGLFWGVNEGLRQLPIEDLDLKSNYCRGNGRSCSETPREQMIIR